MHTLGIDFGTSNSACGVAVDGRAHLIAVEPGAQTLPTAVFFDAESRKMSIGSAANRALISGSEGRYMRALKSVLGTSLMHERRMLAGESLDFTDIIARFLSRLKTAAETACGMAFSHALSGRPVHFHSADAARDAQALEDLRGCYLKAGFDAVDFLFEPEAAALAHGATDGRLGLIVDIGGGTSDFTLFRGREILVSHGVRIGGTQFDRAISLARVMPQLGAGGMIGNAMGDGALPAPVGLFQDLATWQMIPFLYTAATRREVAQMARRAVDPVPFARLLSVLEDETGHDIAFAVERGKIAANGGAGQIDLRIVEPGLSVPLTAEDLAAVLAEAGSAIGVAARDTCDMAGLPPEAVEQVVFVGGSSLMGVVVSEMERLFPKAEQRRSDPFTGVVDGLAIAAGGQR